MKPAVLAALFAAMGNSLSACVIAPQPPPATVAVGWHGDRYYDGHRYWERKEWEEHQQHEHGDHAQDRCPPGLEMQGRC